MGGDTAGRIARTRILLPRLALRDAVSRRERRTIFAGTSPGSLSGSAERMVPREGIESFSAPLPLCRKRWGYVGCERGRFAGMGRGD